ncbi:FAD-dependent oxidoreductase [Solidesulfovibrio magneticus]|uniref:Nucleotide-disulphide oxidoreductase family protein n=1 Tax=Solidesulfovibrio magneticus (strain ATCC 700980 / DSM 13731 / RS-1) TaxID=573370 RepID=C4XSG3_SOLM1|nr:FAD-dependent oxidoreductase [Solidesulfovibrio magneticus]BAH78095.1 nucleotide-disulphide oxidoreductase family protein [Solidesulfovibrio magneticus RS-1]
MAQQTVTIHGIENGQRVQSRILEERIQRAVTQGARDLIVEAFGQHGIGGRLWVSREEPINVRITGSPGQRTGSMGFPGTRIDIDGSVSDDIGWLNAGADIVVRGNAGNGACNAMAQGKVMIAGNIGSRGMTMTKQNPKYAAPELFVLGSVGDYFAEFMAGGTAVVCGFEPQNPDNVLGYRPCVGMVGGRIFFRGPHKGFSLADAKLVAIDDATFGWLTENLGKFLDAIGRPELFDTLSKRDDWQLIAARSPYEKTGKTRRPMGEFRAQVWDAELGRGGLIGDLDDSDRSTIGLIVTGELRRFVPVWENKKYLAPCQASCPTGIPVQERWQLVRDGLMDEAMDLALAYTPFPATVCGYLCPNLCMQGCTRNVGTLKPLDTAMLGKANVKAGKMPKLPELSGKRVAVIGGGPAGMSVAWQLRLAGHEAVIYDPAEKLGGKITSSIPSSRIPADVLDAEIARAREILPHIQTQKALSADEFAQIVTDYDYVVLAVGANKPRMLPVPGKELATPALTFLKAAKKGEGKVGKRVVIIGAGNVGCDVATEAARLGAESITLIDIQKPAAFGKEKHDAEEVGAVFKWPCFTKEITPEGVMLQSGELIPADTVLLSVGDVPDIEFLGDTIATERGHVKVNSIFQTTNPKVFAIGDIVKPGLLTQAIGMGRDAARAIDEILTGKRPCEDTRKMIDYKRAKLEYFDPRVLEFNDLDSCASQCSSCGACRDCGLCETLCPVGAISRQQKEGKEFAMVSDPEKCIGCGFCANACPCGVWSWVENTPLTT